MVLNNLFKHTQLQTTFGANMLAIVDGVPRTLRLDQFVSYYVAHQIEVIVRRTQYRLRRPRSGPTSCARCSRRSTSSTRSSP